MSNKNRILIYAHYYAPDVASTGQILQDLAEGMRDNFDVTVICTVPSYTGTIPENYREKRVYWEELDGVHVLRVPVPPFTKSSKLSRIKNLLAYCIQARKATKSVGKQDYVFTISQPPILGGMLGVYGKNHLRTESGNKPKLIYNIQDFNVYPSKSVDYFWFRVKSHYHADLRPKPIIQRNVGYTLVVDVKRMIQRKSMRLSGAI